MISNPFRKIRQFFVQFVVVTRSLILCHSIQNVHFENTYIINHENTQKLQDIHVRFSVADYLEHVSMHALLGRSKCTQLQLLLLLRQSCKLGEHWLKLRQSIVFGLSDGLTLNRFLYVAIAWYL